MVDCLRTCARASGWVVDDVPRKGSFFFCELENERVCVSIECFEPGAASSPGCRHDREAERDERAANERPRRILLGVRARRSTRCVNNGGRPKTSLDGADFFVLFPYSAGVDAVTL
jgi:hypothetical protein